MKARLSHRIFLSNISAILITLVMIMVASFISSGSLSKKIIEDFDEHHISELIQSIETNYETGHSLDYYSSNSVIWEKMVNEALNKFNPFTQRRPPNCRSTQECQELLMHLEKTPVISGESDNRHGSPEDVRFKPPHVSSFNQRVSLLAPNGTLLVGHVSGNEPGKRFPIRVKSQVIGWVFLAYPDLRREILFSPFFKSALINSYCLAIFGILAITVASYFLSRYITKPILELRDAAREISKRNFKVKININSNDEFGELASSVIDIASELAKYETRLQRWLMDISHELRTPLTILSGEIDAISDGITLCERQNISMLREEVTQIKRLVDDFHDLSVIERIGFKLDCIDFDLKDLVSAQLVRYRDKFQERQIGSRLDCANSEVIVNADINRIIQILQNLYENGLRYVDTPGMIITAIKRDKQFAIIEVEDTGPGVPGDTFSSLFDPLFRAEHSRSRKSGGAGLGLAICKNIVTAHQGEIFASDSRFGGLKITIKLPLSGK